MVDFWVEKTPDGNIAIWNDNIVEGSVPYILNSKREKQFKSLYLQKTDLEEGLAFLSCISPDNSTIVNRGLFIAALINLAKCFQSSKSCNAQNIDKFKRYCPKVSQDFEKYINWRNKHFVHDENDMREATAFIIVPPEGSDESAYFEAAVFWNRVDIDYISEGRLLEQVMLNVKQFVIEEFDKCADSIKKEFIALPREEPNENNTVKIERAKF